MTAAREGGRRARSGEMPAGVSLSWPPDAEAVRSIVAAGFGDRSAARLFGVHPRTFATRRRQLLGVKREDLDGAAPAPAEYGFDRRARWPEWARFEDDPAAGRATSRGRLPSRPETVLPTASTAAL